MEGDWDLDPIWKEVARAKGWKEGLFTLNRALLRGVHLCQRAFGERVHFSASLLLLVFFNNASLMNPYLDPTFAGGGGGHNLDYAPGYG